MQTIHRESSIKSGLLLTFSLFCSLLSSGCLRTWDKQFLCHSDSECDPGEYCGAGYGSGPRCVAGCELYSNRGCAVGLFCDFDKACKPMQCDDAASSSWVSVCGGYGCDMYECKTSCLDTYDCAEGYACRDGACVSAPCGLDPSAYCEGFVCTGPSTCASVCDLAGGCAEGFTCEAGVCRGNLEIDDACSDSYECSAGYHCSSFTGLCVRPALNGESCSEAAECASSNCENGICVSGPCSISGCSDAEYCDSYYDQCIEKAALFEYCSDDAECVSGYCDSDSWFCSCQGCFSDQYCSEETSGCADKKSSYSTCSTDQECVSEWCYYGSCY